MKRQHPFLFVFLTLLFLISFSACQQDNVAKEMSANISSYVYAYTSGSISKAAPIKVRLSAAMVDAAEVGSSADDFLSIQPSVEGSARWEDVHTILFEPKAYLTSNTNYLVKVALHKLFEEVPKDARTFEFNFQTREQHFYVNVDGLQNDPSGDEKKKQLSGRLNTVDIADALEVEKILTAKQGGKNLPIAWQHNRDQISHLFTIEKIDRGETADEVVVSWNGKPIGVSLTDSKSVSIPALGDFKIMDAKVIQGTRPHIVLYFSDPLKQSQDLKGLVTVKGYSGNLEFLVDGSQLRVYPKSQAAGVWDVKAAAGIKSARNRPMKDPSEWKLFFEQSKPRVRLVGNGTIMPNSNGLVFPFEAVNLNYVDVEVLKIFNNNILQFLQTNQMDGNYQLNRVGKIILQKQVRLSQLNPGRNVNQWSRYALDLSELINDDPHAIYQVSLGFRQSYSTYTCTTSDADGGENLAAVEDPFANNNGKFKTIWSYRNFRYEGYQWEHRDDPCFPAYYSNNKFVRRNVLASDMGILAKKGTDENYMLAVTDLRTTQPMSNVDLEFYDYQQQLIYTSKTDADGMAAVDLKDNPFVVVAKKNNQRGYLKLQDQYSKSLSRFDVGGAFTQKGLKGFMYGERGVWRPGDSIYLNFVLEDRQGKLPPNHPVTFELYDARGQLKEKRTTLENIKNVYPLHCATDADAPTGNWRAVAKVGGAQFSKTLKVETVKPNRLKIKMDFKKEKFTVQDKKLDGDLQVNWLHGAPASNLKAKVEMQLKNAGFYVKEYSKYRFSDPTKRFNQEPQTIFEGQLDGNGFSKVSGNINVKGIALGKVRADFKIRAFEKGGDFSADNFSVDYDPFESYAGVSIPRNRYGQHRLVIGEDGKINFVALDGEGKPMKNRKLSVGLYRVTWRWWWDSNRDNLMKYNSDTHAHSEKTGTLTTNSKGEAEWNVNVDEWGRYLVRVIDTESGHSSGNFFYAGYPWYGYADNSDEYQRNQMRQAAAMLAFSSDKEKYYVGDQVELSIPASESGRCLISIESGSKIVETYWVDATKGDNKFTFYVEPEMAPTVYAHVTLIQPHAQVKNDLPIRMYGVIPIHVEDKNTRLNPIIKMPDELEPKATFAVEVSEQEGKPMAYTLAVVDDGLLDLTRFKTPNPWNTFYAREALGVKTWDVYDQVLGAYGGKLESILSIGGDGEVAPDAGNKKANRFKPVVRHIGPFYLEKGKKAVHQITMPNYVGSVRTMVVASHEGAYGNAEKTTPVKKPLMLLATLPRVLGPGETLKLPVNIFAMDKKVKNVSVKIEETSGLVSLLGNTTQQLSFSKPGDDMATFDIKVKDAIGVANFKISAKGGGENASQEIEIQVRNPNPMVAEVSSKVLQPGEDWSKDFEAVGVVGTNVGTMEISNIPPINLNGRLRYLIRYPHGCVEQTTSSVFPQLYVNKLLDIDEKKKKRVERNIRAGIARLKRFQNSSGGLGYWMGDRSVSDWGTSYAGHFLLEAEALGYQLPINMKDRWVSYQSKAARKWANNVEQNQYGDYRYRYNQNQLTQAYRLYVLALSGNAELGAMNQMREFKELHFVAKWRLAQAYAEAGKPEVADQLIQGLQTEVEAYKALGYSYGSDLRDEAMILETLTRMGKLDQAGGIAKHLAEQISTNRWYGTQTVAYCLLAVGKFVGDNHAGKDFKFAYQIGNGQNVNAGSSKPLMQFDVPVDGNARKSISIKNTSNGILYARLILEGQPLVGDQKEEQKNLQMTVTYRDMKGKTIDPTKLTQGTDFVAEVKVTNPGNYYRLDEMALNQVFPSGWEIHNTRMSNVTNYTNTTKPEYQDIRDDRVYTYFDIWRKKTHTYRVQLNAAYQGKYYLPTVYCEAMYNNEIFSRKPGKWVEVTPPNTVTASSSGVNIEAGNF